GGRWRRRGGVVALGSCGLARGASATRAALLEAVERAELDATVDDGACNGLCHAQPVVEILMPGLPRLTVERVTSDRVAALLGLLRGESDHGFAASAWPYAAHPVLGGQARCLADRWGAIRPASLDDALRTGGYAALAEALDRGDPDPVSAPL